MDEQVVLMEKSYELASKYMGGQNGQQTAQASPVRKAEEHTAMPVKQVTRQVVSSLAQPMSNAEFAAMYAQERNMGFHTAVGSRTVSDKNTISACIWGTERDGRAGCPAAASGADGGCGENHPTQCRPCRSGKDSG